MAMTMTDNYPTPEVTVESLNLLLCDLVDTVRYHEDVAVGDAVKRTAQAIIARIQAASPPSTEEG